MTTENEGPFEAVEASRGRFTLFDSIVLTPFRDLSASFKAMDYETFRELPNNFFLRIALFCAVLLVVAVMSALYLIALVNLLTGNDVSILLGALGLHLAYCIISPLAKLCWNALPG